tara:strand:+ start:432 stop:1226 length:795 start_codon:yes stop_codon:yes gene_type:complete
MAASQLKLGRRAGSTGAHAPSSTSICKRIMLTTLTTLPLSYQCGKPLSSDYETVTSAYSSWKSKYVQTMSGGCCVGRPGSGSDCVSEGTGYAMIFSAYMQDQTTFECMWSFAKTKFDSNGLMNWHISKDGNVAGSGSAFDADEDMAYALLLGCEKFGAPFCADASSLVKRLMLYEIETPTYTPKAGDGWGGCSTTNPSYFAPAYYPLFYNATGDSNWLAVSTQCYSIISKMNSKVPRGPSGRAPPLSSPSPCLTPAPPSRFLVR